MRPGTALCQFPQAQSWGLTPRSRTTPHTHEGLRPQAQWHLRNTQNKPLEGNPETENHQLARPQTAETRPGCQGIRQK